MAGQASGRVNPRALLRSLKTRETEAAAPRASGIGRAGAIALCAAVSLAAFGTIVVRANDDSGALAFIRSQTKPRAVAPDYAPSRAAYPVSYFAPRAFYPQAAVPSSRRTQTAPAPQGQNQRNSPIVASYAPFTGFFPTGNGAADDKRVRSPARIATPSVAKPTLAAPFPNVAAAVARGTRVTYCVRTCDGFYFPLSASTGSDRADEAACNRLCPTSETKLYVGQVGGEMDDARARHNGRRYAQMGNAFAYRTSLSKSCACNAQGVGLTTDASVYRDQTLKVGDVVMTDKGMRVFTGGQFPYRPSHFSSIGSSSRYTGKSGEALRTLEQASLPGRSGVTQRQPRRKTDEVADLRRAAESLRAPDQVVRYVGPDRSAVAR
jgi:hypothetical protein